MEARYIPIRIARCGTMPNKLCSIKNKKKEKREKKSQVEGNRNKNKLNRKTTQIGASKDVGNTKQGVLWSHQIVNGVITPNECHAPGMHLWRNHIVDFVELSTDLVNH